MVQFAFAIMLLGMLVAVQVSAHTHHLHDAQKEREEDGARAPRDHTHYNEEEHNTDFDHEAILGSAKEAEEYENLPPTEAKRRLEILLYKMDRNNDKNIDRFELQSWILRSFRALSEEESAERLEEVDENDDGFVTWSEYVAETYGIRDGRDKDALGAEDELEEDQLLKEDQVLFKAADRDGDNRLSESEFLSFTHPEEDKEMLPVVLQQTLEMKDENGDGVIDFQEFVGERGHDKDKEWLLTEKEKFDVDHDSDSNGVLDAKEIIDWVIPSNEEIAADEVDHLFAAANDDGDDFLSFFEVLDHHDVFVGSEATDYGDHLKHLDRFGDEL